MEYWPIVLSVVIVVLGTDYLFRNFNIFKRRGVIHVPPISILGAMTPVIFRRMSFVDFIRKMYNFDRDAKYIGFYSMTKPVLLLRDPELIKTALVKHHDVFFNRPVDFNEHILTQNLFSLQGKKWQDVKKLLSPFFTSGKLKEIFISVSEYAADFAKFLSTLPAAERDVNMKDVFNRYTNDVIALCAYGIKIDSMKNPTNRFFTSGKKITYMSKIISMKYIFIRAFPKLGRILNLKLLDEHAMNYFGDCIKNEIAIRDAKHMTRPDMIQLMMNNRGKDRIQLEMDDMIAQAYSFYFGGFETSSSVMSFIAYQIAINLSVQVKLRQEIDKVLDDLNGNVTYEAINQLEYLHAVMKEALRLYAPSILERVCNEDYKLPPALPGEKPFTVNSGMLVWVPVYAIHRDEKYYDDPEEFRPERFLDNKHDSSFYFPFGLGPKTCIGKRFGILKIKIVLFHLLAQCELKPCMKTISSMTFTKKQLLMMPENGFWLNVQRRDDVHPMLKPTT